MKTPALPLVEFQIGLQYCDGEKQNRICNSSAVIKKQARGMTITNAAVHLFYYWYVINICAAVLLCI